MLDPLFKCELFCAFKAISNVISFNNFGLPSNKQNTYKVNHKMFSSLERIYPDQLDKNDTLGKEALALHLQRYQFAGKYLTPGLVADAACGVGYGSYLLATGFEKTNTKITAIDIDTDVINYARQRYRHPSIEFLKMDLFDYKSANLFNTIISLETIEHLPDPQQFVLHMTSQLAVGGRFIASAPVTPSVDANPYHLHDFTERSFKKLFTAAGLTEVGSLLQVQRYKPFNVVSKPEGRSNDIRKGLISYYLKNPSSLWKRIKSIGTDGFTNKYLVVAFEKK